MRPLLAFLVVIAAWCAWPRAAWARPPRVVVAEFAHDDDGDVRAAVMEAIGDEVVLVGKKEVAKAVDRLKLSDAWTDKEVAKLIKAVTADAVLKADLDTGGDTLALHVKLYVKAGGKPKGFTLHFSNSRSEKFKKAMHDTVRKKLAIQAAPDGDGDDGGGSDSGDATPAKGGDKGSNKGAQGAKGGGSGDKGAKASAKGSDSESGSDDNGSDDNGPDDNGAPAEPSDARPFNLDAVRIDVGLSLTGRSLSFVSRDFPEAPKPYSNGVVPGSRVEGEIYPFAFSPPHGVLGGLGFGFDYDRTFSLTLHSTLIDGTAVAADATQHRYSVGARYRLLFGAKGPSSPSVIIGVSYGTRTFVVDRANLSSPNDIDIPDVKYSSIQPGLTARIPVTDSITLLAASRAYLITGAGPVTTSAQYGQARITGLEASAGVDFGLTPHVALRLLGEYALYGFAFTGNGEESIDRDGDPSTKDVGGAKDQYFGVAATLAYSY